MEHICDGCLTKVKNEMSERVGNKILTDGEHKFTISLIQKLNLYPNVKISELIQIRRLGDINGIAKN